MADTTRLTLPLIAAAQAQKHVTHNEAVLRLDGLVQMNAKSYSTSAQPGSPADGDLYLLPAGKTGSAWGGYSNHAVAHYYDGIWHQYHPRAGWLCFVVDTGFLYYYTGTLWAVVPATGIADGTVSAPGLPGSTDSNSGFYKIAADNWGVAMGGAAVMKWLGAGNTQPLQPAFLAYLASNAANQTGDGTVYYLAGLTEVYDQGANFNATTGIFTAPVTGRYWFGGAIRVQDLNAAAYTYIDCHLYTSNRLYSGQVFKPSNYETLSASAMALAFSALADMDAGDTAKFGTQVHGGAKSVDISGDTIPISFFSGALIA